MATELDMLNNDTMLKVVRISEALVKAGDRFRQTFLTASKTWIFP